MNDNPVQSKSNDEFSQALLRSAVLHLGIITLFVLKLVFFPSEPIDYKSAIRVDMVELPDKIPDNIPKPVAPPQVEPPKEAPAPKVEPVKPKVSKEKRIVNLKKTQDEALKRLKALEKIENALKEKNKKIIKEAAKKVEYKGNVISPGTALKGITKLEYDSYIGSLDAHVKNNWELPEWLAQGGWKVEVLVKIDNQGLVVSRTIRKSSGNTDYDQKALDAIDRSNPFPAPPLKFKGLLEIEGVRFGFPE